MWTTRIGCRALEFALLLTLITTEPTFAGERSLEDAPPASSIEEIDAPLELSYPEPETRPSALPAITRRMENLTPFLADSKLYLRYRTYYLNLDRANRSLSEAWAMGGSIYYRSGWLMEFFSVELEGFTSQPIVAPDRRGGTLLLKDPGQRGYSVLGVANAKFQHRGFLLTGFRQKLDLPYLNRQDNRMTPNTFEAIKLSKEEGPLRFLAGYAWNFKSRNSDDFAALSRQAGASESRGAAFGNVLWYPNEDFHIGASGYVVPDVLATVYAESSYDMYLSKGVGLRLDGQFTHQQTVGEELMAAPPFDTWNLGVRTTTSWRGAVLQLAFAITGEERRIESFFGSSPSFISLMQRTYTQADEKAILIGLSYDFSGLGIDGLTAIANFAHSWDGVVAGVRGDAREFNLTLDYRIEGGWLESFWLRVRGAWINEEAAAENGTDFRVILRYDFPVI